MKKKRNIWVWFLYGALLVVFEVLLWGIIVGSEELFVLWVINGILVWVLFWWVWYKHLVATWNPLVSKIKRVADLFYILLRNYWFVVISILSAWKAMSIYMFWGSYVWVFLWCILWLLTVWILRDELLQKNIYWWHSRLSWSSIALMFGVVLVWVVLTQLWAMGIEKYTIAAIAWLLCSTIMMLSQWDDLKDVIKSPWWVVFAWVTVVSILWFLGQLFYGWINTNTVEVEKVIYKDRVVYLPLRTEEAQQLSDGSCAEWLCLTSDGYCVLQPVNSVCDKQLEQWRECLAGYTQARDECVLEVGSWALVN